MLKAFLAVCFLCLTSSLSAQEPLEKECDVDISSAGLQGTHCHLLSINVSESGLTAARGNCVENIPCAITEGQLQLIYTGTPDPNIDVISNEGIIPVVTGGDTYTFSLTEVEAVECDDEAQFTFSLIYYISGAPWVICELRHTFKCIRCDFEV